jgi:hypothetical protein
VLECLHQHEQVSINSPLDGIVNEVKCHKFLHNGRVYSIKVPASRDEAIKDREAMQELNKYLTENNGVHFTFDLNQPKPWLDDAVRELAKEKGPYTFSPN